VKIKVIKKAVTTNRKKTCPNSLFRTQGLNLRRLSPKSPTCAKIRPSLGPES